MLMQDLFAPVDRQAEARPHQAARELTLLVGHQLGTWTVLHQLRTCESDCESYEHQCGAQKHKCGAVYLSQKRWNVDTWTKKHCWTDDDVTWKVQFTQRRANRI